MKDRKINSRRRKGNQTTGMEEVVRRYRRSGLTQEAFALQEGMSVWTLRNWCRRVGSSRAVSQKTTPELVEVRKPLASAGPERSRSRDYRIEWPDGTALVVPAGFELGEVGPLIEMLRRGS